MNIRSVSALDNLIAEFDQAYAFDAEKGDATLI